MLALITPIVRIIENHCLHWHLPGLAQRCARFSPPRPFSPFLTAFFNALLASLNVRELIFGESSDYTPKAPDLRGREARKVRPTRSSKGVTGKSGMSSEVRLCYDRLVRSLTKHQLAVHVETTTLHRIDENCDVAGLKKSRRWKSEKTASPDVWIPMDSRYPDIDKLAFGDLASVSEHCHSTPTENDQDTIDIEARSVT
jgi:hypothetical protein